MSEILWVNPVGTGAFDAETLELIAAVASDRHLARVRHLQSGPPHLEYHLYEHEALSGMLQLMRQAEEDGKWIPKMSDNALVYGLERRVASFRSVEMGIPQVQADPETFLDRVLEQGRRAVEEDGAEAIVLSEIPSPDFWERARAELPVPLVDPGVAAWKWAELAAELYERVGLSHSKRFGYEAPA